MLGRRVERYDLEVVHQVVPILDLLQERPHLDHQDLKLLAQELDRLFLVDPHLSEALNRKLPLIE